MKDHIAEFFSTFCYVGYFPFAAGSLATVIGGLIAGVLVFHPFVVLLLFVIVTALGFLLSSRMEQIAGEKDPSCIVIDEVSGALIAFFMLPLSWPVFMTTFFVFRAFDMWKIYPADVFERRHGGVGVMMDDIVAGIYTNLIMQIAIRVAGIV